MLLRHVHLQAFLGGAGLHAYFAVVFEYVWEMPGLHVIPDLAPAVVAEGGTDGTGPLGVARALEAEGEQILGTLGLGPQARGEGICQPQHYSWDRRQQSGFRRKTSAFIFNFARYLLLAATRDSIY